MRYLLDSHSLLWYATNSAGLSSRAEQTISETGNEILVSIATFWELAIKQNIGKLRISSLAALRERVEGEGMQLLGIELRHTERIVSLPAPSSRPF